MSLRDDKSELRFAKLVPDLVGQEISGKTLNELGKNRKFYICLTDSDLDKYRENSIYEDKNDFDAKSEWNGKYYFYDSNDMHNWCCIRYAGTYSTFSTFETVANYYAEIIIPNNAKICIYDDRIKTSIFELGIIKFIWNDCTLVPKLLKKRGYLLKFVPRPSYDMCVTAIIRNPDVIQFVTDPSYDMCVTAITRNPDVIQFVSPKLCVDNKNVYEDLCILAISLKPDVLQYIGNQTEKMCITAIQKNPFTIRHVKNQTKLLCIMAVEINGHTLKFIGNDNRSYDICKKAVENCGGALEHMDEDEKKKDICMIAIKNDPYSLHYINPKKRTPKMIKTSYDYHKNVEAQIKWMDRVNWRWRLLF
jgi:hypothetical protein